MRHFQAGLQFLGRLALSPLLLFSILFVVVLVVIAIMLLLPLITFAAVCLVLFWVVCDQKALVDYLKKLEKSDT